MNRIVIIPFVLLLLSGFSLFAGTSPTDTLPKKKIIYSFPIQQEIAKPAWRITKKSLEAAKKMHADYILIRMNTYGGLLNSADSIRTALLKCPIPTMVYIDNNAASAGALISIACDSIYMHSGSTIGAATVVNQTGKQVPDKYQSYMRGMMRATAEAHGKDTLIRGRDTLIRWHRDPRIAEAMVDPRVSIPGISDSGKVITLTTNEAIQLGYAEARAENIEEVMEHAGIKNYEIKEFIITPMEKIIGFLASPAISGILIMIIVGGIYFELRTPGVGFPLAAAVLAAIIYFAPLYLEGLAQHWEIILFIIGLILIAVEIFAIPGFGIAGISGILLVVTGLTLSMVPNVVFKFNTTLAFRLLIKSLFIVLISSFTAIFFSLFLTKKAAESGKLKFALHTSLNNKEGFVGVEQKQQDELTGKTGIAATLLRPAGKVEIDGEIYDAVSEISYIEKGTSVRVVKNVAGQIYVVPEKEV